MQKAKLDVLVAQLAYGGNGGVATVLPSLVPWFARLRLAMEKDDRIGRVGHKTYGDVPLSMERNRIVKEAIDGGFDVILMLDSDNIPDMYLGHRERAKPFWETSFSFLYERKVRGLPTVVCAPYCGPPPNPVGGGQENVYVFYAEGDSTPEPGGEPPQMKFTGYTRAHAAQMSGIQPIAAGPTGVIMYSTCALEMMPRRVDPTEVLEQYRQGQLTMDRAIQLLHRKSWFYYEYTDADRTQKASTEDVTNTREIQMAGVLKHGEPVVFCNWDAWAGHYKPKCVGAPEPIPIESVTEAFKEAVRNNVSVTDRAVELDLPDLPYEGPTLGFRDEDEQPTTKSTSDGPMKFTIERNGHPFTHLGFMSNQNDLCHLQNLVKSLPKMEDEHGEPRDILAVEVGSWVGDSAVGMIEAREDIQVVCVDTFEGTDTDPCGEIARKLEAKYGDGVIQDTWTDNTRPYDGRISMVEAGTSQETARAFDDGEVDFLYLDAGHTYEDVLSDLRAWAFKVRPGGVIAGHDYGDPQYPGVKDAVDQVFANYTVNVKGHVWWVVNKEPQPKAEPITMKSANKTHGNAAV